MAAPSVTYTFTNGTTADATEVNQNFTDIINGITDGTEDLTISALTCNGVATLNGAVTLGDATSDDITVNGYIASSLLPKTSATSDLGSSAQNWQHLYLDNGATDSGTIYFDAGTTYFIQGNTAVLDIGGFTSLDLNATADVVAGQHIYMAVNNGTIYDEGDPVYSFTGDTDTGMFSESANQLDFATGGSARMSIDSSGQVGIGNNAPSHLLHIEGTSNPVSLQIESTGGEAVLRLVGDQTAGANIIGSVLFLNDPAGAGEDSVASIECERDSANDASKLVFNTQATGGAVSPRMTIESEGLVGIGNKNPGDFDSRANNFLVYEDGDMGMTLAAGATSDARIQFCDILDTGLNHGIISYDLNADSMAFASAGTVSVTINSSGNVGINETTIDAKLHVSSGSNECIKAQTTTTAEHLVCERTSAAQTWRAGIGGGDEFVFYDITDSREVLHLSGGGSVKFPGIATTASAANAFLDSGDSNNIQRSTSSVVYKKDIKDVTDEESETIYSMRPITYRSKIETDDQSKIHLGFLAEDLHQINPKLVHYKREKKQKDKMKDKPIKDKEKDIEISDTETPDGVQYERLCVLLVKELQKLKTRIETLEGA